MSETAIVTCTGCGAKNRIPKERLRDRPVCGKCRAGLDTAGVSFEPKAVTDATFQSEVMGHKGLVMVQFWAPWCGHCKGMEPTIRAAARDYAGRVKIVTVNSDENSITASAFRIMSLPSQLFVRDGKVVNTTAGAMTRGQLDQVLRPML